MRRAIQLLALVLSLAFTCAYGWFSLDVIDSMAGIPYTSLPLGQDVGYYALPVSAVLVCLALVIRIAETVMKRSDAR